MDEEPNPARKELEEKLFEATSGLLHQQPRRYGQLGHAAEFPGQLVGKG